MLSIIGAASPSPPSGVLKGKGAPGQMRGADGTVGLGDSGTLCHAQQVGTVSGTVWKILLYSPSFHSCGPAGKGLSI